MHDVCFLENIFSRLGGGGEVPKPKIPKKEIKLHMEQQQQKNAEFQIQNKYIEPNKWRKCMLKRIYFYAYAT